MKNISRRLLVIKEEIAKRGFQDIVYDIGADHAYLPIYLLKSGICATAAASDISLQSLNRARFNAAENGVAGNIAFYAGDGLSAIKDYKPCKIVVIAGIGGINLIKIIERDIEKARAASLLILQPMNGQEALREWLLDNMFSIEYERLAGEGRRIYNVIICCRAEKPSRRAPEELYIGCGVVYENEAEYIHFLTFTRSKMLDRYNGLKAARTARDNGKNEAMRLGAALRELDRRLGNIL